MAKGVAMSEEQRAAVSERMKRVWEKRRAKAQGYQESPIVGVTPRSTADQLAAEEPFEEKPKASSTSGDKWIDLPFEKALADLMDLEKEVKHARAVISFRNSKLPITWTCWTALNRVKQGHLPGMQTAYSRCHKSIPDGKWVFKDDCVINDETGLIDPVVCCRDTCYQIYQIYRTRLKLKERERSA